MEKVKKAGIADIEIERTSGQYRVVIKASRPGLIIGRGGEGVQQLEKAIKKVISSDTALSLNVEELKRTDVSAQVVAQNMAWDLEKRMPFRRIMKKYIEQVMQGREAKGVKILLSGRLGGAEIARTEKFQTGSIPLSRFNINIDHAVYHAKTTYGVTGVKVWVNLGPHQFIEEED